MKRLGLLLALAVMLGGTAFAVPQGSRYFTTYFSNANTANAPDATVRVINDGSTGYDLYAAIYVFDDSEELTECCDCEVTPDGLLSESVNKELTANEFTGRGQIARGVIKVVADSLGNATAPVPAPGLRGWMTHIQATTTTFPAPGPGNAVNAVEKGPWFVTEDALADSNLTELEASNLGTLCSYGLTIGSGYGYCPCTVEDYDF